MVPRPVASLCTHEAVSFRFLVTRRLYKQLPVAKKAQNKQAQFPARNCLYVLISKKLQSLLLLRYNGTNG